MVTYHCSYCGWTTVMDKQKIIERTPPCYVDGKRIVSENTGEPHICFCAPPKKNVQEEKKAVVAA